MKKVFISIIIVLIILTFGVVSFAAYYAVSKNVYYPVIWPAEPLPIVCTQDVKQCSDGSYVSRFGPRCEFAECPQPAPAPSPTPTPISNKGYITLREGERSGPLLVQKIYPTYITGLNFREYPIAIDKGQPITLHIGESVSNGCTIFLELLRIEGETAIFNPLYSKQPCPICLAKDTKIDTPLGPMNVQDLQIGMQVWTTDKQGNFVAQPIVKTSKVPVSPSHQMIHLVLDDGRELFVSPGHPVTNGHAIDDLRAGEMYDGALIVSVSRVLYAQGYTYDVLPDGETGFYTANGILIGSTLK